MFERNLTPKLKEAVKQFPVVVLTGPRQSGKTTLLKKEFPHFKYVNLESPETLSRLQDDPIGFLSTGSNWIIDEAQNLPEIFSYIQVKVDETPQKLKFILSGSQNFLLIEKVSQTLAGRAAILELLPLTYSEYLSNANTEILPIWDYIHKGSYPRPYYEHINFDLWLESYIRTYLERDVRSLINIKDLLQFQLFIKHCAGMHGQLLNLSLIANACGISQPTAKHWLSILESSYITYRLQPHYNNFKKRLVKMPKLYFYDSGIVCKLLGIESPDHLQIHSHRGAIFEGFVLTEIAKYYYNIGKKPPMYFWRDHSGIEVDCILEKGEILNAIEIKSTMTYNHSLLTALNKWQKFTNSKGKKAMIFAGSEEFKIKDIGIISWKNIEKNLIKGNL